MRRFKFSLETVLRVKRSREEQLQLEFSAILKRRAACLGRIALLDRRLSEAVEAQKGGREKTLDAAWIELFETSRRASLEKIAAERHSLGAIEAEQEAKRLELVSASRETKVLEKLEEGQREAYLEKFNREEQAFLDELASHNSAASRGGHSIERR